MTAPMLPPAFDPPFYRARWPDLAGLDDAQATSHYQHHGRAEGRQANQIDSREAFVALIPPGAAALEIGPFCRPMLSGPNARFFDVLDQQQLRHRARQIGLPDAAVPAIDYVSPTGDLGIVEDTFQALLSSHCIEHQPDLVAHLQHAERLLQPGGRYFLLVPDHRYIFDAFLSPSTLAGVIEAHMLRRQVHTLRSVIEHRVMTTHNQPELHWNGEHGALVDTKARLDAALQEWSAAQGGYIDVHAWYFTPDSAEDLIATLRHSGYIGLQVERLYPTLRGNNEFWMVLNKPES